MKPKEKPRPTGPPAYRPMQKTDAAAAAKKGPATPAAYRPQTPAAPKRDSK